MNGVYPGRGAKAYAPLRGPSQCAKQPCNTCAASSQCVKRLCNTCTASSQCVKRLCNTCATPSQCVKRLCNTCAASSQCAKRLCNTCTAPSQCVKRPCNTCAIPSQCAKRLCNTCTAFSQCVPALFPAPPAVGGGRMQFAPTRVPGQTSLPPQGPPLHVSGKLRCPRRGRPYPGTIIWPRVPGKLRPRPQTPSPPPNY